MHDRLSLDFLTALDLPAAGLVHLANDLGVTRVSLLVAPLDGLPDFGLDRPGPARRAVLDALRDTGVKVDMAEPFYLHADTVTDDLLPGFDTAAELGARTVNLLARTADQGQLAAQMAAACNAAHARGMEVVTEISKRGSLVTLSQTAAFIETNALPLGIELDSLHFFRAGGKVADIAPHAHHVGRIQLCDLRAGITPDQEWDEAIRNRALPGHGIADLADFLDALPLDAVIGLEIPQPGIPGPEAARRARDATLKLFKSEGY